MKIGVYELVFITPVCTGWRTLRWRTLRWRTLAMLAVVERLEVKG